MVHCESLLSNDAFSHHIAHIGCMVPGCTEVSLTQREREGKKTERNRDRGRVGWSYRPNNICITANVWLTERQLVCCF